MTGATTSHSNYPELFRPLLLPCGVEVPNRIAIAPMTTWSSHDDGTLAPEEEEYLAARSGPGLVITAACYVISHGKAFDGQWGCHDDAMLPSLRRAADIIRAGGGLPVLQLHHGGRLCPSALTGRTPLAPGDVMTHRPGFELPEPMNEEEITETIAAFAEATHRAAEAGYAGVEIHGANGYLLQQFYSPHANNRTDRWGGNIERRMRFPLAIADAVIGAAQNAGRPFAVGYRFSPEEPHEPGIDLAQTFALLDALAERRLDWLHVSVGNYRAGSVRDDSHGRTLTRTVLEHIALRIPVIGVGGVVEADDAVELLHDGCSLAALGRILLMEPAWVQKVREGRQETIRRFLPSTDGVHVCTLPPKLYAKLLGRNGWLPVKDADEPRSTYVE